MPLTKRERRRLRRSGLNTGDDVISAKGMNLLQVEPKTWNQELTFNAYRDDKHLLIHGSAGTGKTFISMYLALNEIFSKQSTYKNVTIVRSVVPTRDIGFLPGKEEDKIGVYEQPYRSICNELFSRGDAYDICKEKGLIDFMCTSFIRGLTLRDTIVIIDEMQNMTGHELSTIVTRLGDNCRVLLCGDFRQSDLKSVRDREGLSNFMKIIDRVEDFYHVEYTRHDIVRSKLVRDFIIAGEDLGISL